MKTRFSIKIALITTGLTLSTHIAQSQNPEFPRPTLPKPTLSKPPVTKPKVDIPKKPAPRIPAPTPNLPLPPFPVPPITPKSATPKPKTTVYSFISYPYDKPDPNGVTHVNMLNEQQTYRMFHCPVQKPR